MTGELLQFEVHYREARSPSSPRCGPSPTGEGQSREVFPEHNFRNQSTSAMITKAKYFILLPWEKVLEERMRGSKLINYRAKPKPPLPASRSIKNTSTFAEVLYGLALAKVRG